MTYWLGYLVSKEWLLQRGIAKRFGTDKTLTDRNYTISESARDLMKEAGVAPECSFTRVVALKSGNVHMCLALASTNPRETMYMRYNLPSAENLESLKRVLKKADHIEARKWKSAS
ncbi:hypothetical protein OBBRIDRAFT_837324 [Obba rivulosa]|uniref:Uncharacterized protein n=1 Tax=Obba rivulosa TaxID=1052685 RepID=A0A8E2DGU9_9APHY|nr:hypothetical protein OBBRIDRAFT_837324 [Obba rivulosa]